MNYMNIKPLILASTTILLLGVMPVLANNKNNKNNKSEYIRNRLISISNDEYPLGIRHDYCGQFTVTNPDDLYIKWEGNSRGMTLNSFLDTYVEIDFSVYVSLHGYTNDNCPLGFPVDNGLEVTNK